MFFIAIGGVLLVPTVINLANRILEEVVIPNQDFKLLKKRRAEQGERGIPEKNRAVFHRIPLNVCLTDEEFEQLKASGMHQMLIRAANRYPYVKALPPLQDPS